MPDKFIESACKLTDTFCARRPQRSTALQSCCAMIFDSSGSLVALSVLCRGARRSIPMMALDRSTFSRRSILFLLVLLGIPGPARSSNLEDSARELAQKIAAALPAGQNVEAEVRNASSLHAGDVARIEQAFKVELQDRGVGLSATGDTATVVLVTLSENYKELVWTGEIRQGDTSHVVMIALDRSAEKRAFSRPMPVTIHADKFWEGPEGILDAEELAGLRGQPWFVLLLRDRLLILEPFGRIAINFPSAASRDPVGKLGPLENGNKISFSLPSRVCSANLDLRRFNECLPIDGPGAAPASTIPLLTDLAPVGPIPQGKGIALSIGAVCQGSTRLFLATSGQDYTQTDSLQVFQIAESGSPVPASVELEFPGPIMALHSAGEGPRAVVRNLATGNYEAYRLSISCG
jgi:hypothetical protein